MRFASTTDTLDSTLTLPMSSGEYTIPAIDAKTGLILKERMAAFEGAARRINAGEDAETVNAEIVKEHGITVEELQNLGEMSLGKELRDQMLDDGITFRELELAEMTAFLFHTVSDSGEAAEAYWKSGGKAPKPNRAQRRTATQTQQGAGTTIEETGLSDWYEAEGRRVQEGGKQWKEILGHWNHIEADLQEHYGIDVGTGILTQRSWRWLEVRIVGLLAIESSRLRLTLYPPEKTKKSR